MYLKMWQGVVSGSMGGRDDGQPETKTRVIDNLEDLVSTYDAKAKYFKLEPVDITSVVSAIKSFSL
jgi:hypothetical protein